MIDETSLTELKHPKLTARRRGRIYCITTSTSFVNQHFAFEHSHKVPRFFAHLHPYLDWLIAKLNDYNVSSLD